MYPYWLSLTAEGYGRAGQPEAGLQALMEPLTLIVTTEERWWEAELCRLKGELLLRLPTPDIHQAEASFLQGLDVARRQQVKASELRAAFSLSRPWQGQLLAPIYGWFAEGFDMPDWREAQELLTAMT
jgi:predicted ATPase